MEFKFNDISYTKVGTGPHLCFLHGFCENKTMWDGLLKSLNQNYTCIAIDLPGYGRSSDLTFSSITDLVASVRSILQHENATNVVLLGHSMGGYVVAEYINQYKSELSAAAFIHSTAAADNEAKKINRDKSINFIAKYGTDEFFKVFIPSLVAPEQFNRLEPKLKALVHQTNKKAIINGLIAMKDRKDHTETIRSFTKPLLFIIGERDDHYSKNSIYKQAAHCQLVQIDCLSNVGHLSPLESPKQCTSSISTFLRFIANTA